MHSCACAYYDCYYYISLDKLKPMDIWEFLFNHEIYEHLRNLIMVDLELSYYFMYLKVNILFKTWTQNEIKILSVKSACMNYNNKHKSIFLGKKCLKTYYINMKIKYDFMTIFEFRALVRYNINIFQTFLVCATIIICFVFHMRFLPWT